MRQHYIYQHLHHGGGGGSWKEKRAEAGQEKIFEKIIAKNLPSLGMETLTQVKKAHIIPDNPKV